MTREDIIRMAREATDEYAKENAWRKNFWRFSQEELQRFAALVAEAERKAERERMTVNSIHSCHPECDRPGCVAVRKAVEAEREACIQDVRSYGGIHIYDAGKIVEAIRARGSK
jgi:hypothetical protein